MRDPLHIAALFFAALASSGSQLHAQDEMPVSFSVEASALSDEGRVQVGKVASQVQAAPGTVVVIRDKTFGLIADSKDYLLDRTRAMRVFQALVLEGVDAERIVVRTPEKRSSVLTVFVEPRTSSTTPMVSYSPGPDQTTRMPGPQEFRFHFPKGSAEFLSVEAERLQSLFRALRHPSKNDIIIEGYTDPDGDEEYNALLSELRALRIFELLVRAGISPWRLKTFGRGVDPEPYSRPATKAMKAASRNVSVRWVVDELEPPQEVALPVAHPVKDEVDQVATSWFELVPFIGRLQPLGDLSRHAFGDEIYGLGIGKTFWRNGGSARATIFASGRVSLKPKEADRSGPLTIQQTLLRSDYVFNALPVSARIHPFIGIGVGWYRWDATIVQPSSLLENSGKKADAGAVCSLGMDIVSSERLIFSPEVSYHSVGGGFNEAFVTALLTARWSVFLSK